MTLFSDKYSNNYRVVSGSVSARANDTALACNTSSGSVTITLQGIPTGKWNAIWALYIFDYSNNAGTNSITIVAGSGQTINGASSITLSVNGCYAKIVIANNTSYLAFSSISAGAITQAYTTVYDEGSVLTQRFRLNFIGAAVTATDDAPNARTNVTINAITSAYTTILDENVSLTQRTKLNFTGAGVTATDDSGGGKTDVTIPGGCDSLHVTKALYNTASIYPPDGAGLRSVVSATKVIEYDSKYEDGVTGFNLLNGVWTVAQAGYYNLNARLVTRLDGTDVNANQDGSSNYWMSSASAVGFIAIGLILNTSTPTVQLLASNKQVVTQNISDVNIDTTCGSYYLSVGDTVQLNILNKTDNTIQGFAASSSVPDCVFEFTAIKIR